MAGGALSNRPGANRKTIGRLRHRVKIQVLDESTRDASGQVVPLWVDAATVWATVDPLSGKEIFASSQVQANVSHRVVTRALASFSLTPKNRLIWLTNANQVLNVVAVLPTVGTANSLEIWCLREESGS
jgi:SPP1 family predicted phage head-tail adaptor